jgi:tetratricopeptide (TPR) repeat protein
VEEIAAKEPFLSRSRLMLRIALAIAVAVIAQMLATSASAQGDDMSRAKEAFSRGQTAFDAGHYREAREAFEESLAAFPHFRTLFNIGLCAEKLGDVKGAVDMYQRYVDWPGEVPNREDVATKLTELKASLPQEPLQPSQAEVNPQRPEPTRPSVGTPEDETRPDLRVPGWIAVGTGAAGVVVGAVFLGLAQKKKSEMEDIAGVQYDPATHDALPEDGKRDQTIGWIAGGVGLAVAATGAILLLVSRRGDGGDYGVSTRVQRFAFVPNVSAERAIVDARWSF